MKPTQIDRSKRKCKQTATIYKVFKFLILLFSVVLLKSDGRQSVRVWVCDVRVWVYVNGLVCKTPGGNFSPNFCHFIFRFALIEKNFVVAGFPLFCWVCFFNPKRMHLITSLSHQNVLFTQWNSRADDFLFIFPHLNYIKSSWKIAYVLCEEASIKKQPNKQMMQYYTIYDVINWYTRVPTPF